MTLTQAVLYRTRTAENFEFWFWQKKNKTIVFFGLSGHHDNYLELLVKEVYFEDLSTDFKKSVTYYLDWGIQSKLFDDKEF